MVIDPYATKHRFGQETIKLITSKKDKDLTSRAGHLFKQSSMLTLDELLHQLGISQDEWESAVDDPVRYGLKQIEDPNRSVKLLTTKQQWDSIWSQIRQQLNDYHQRYPLREGMDRKLIQQLYFPQLNTAQWNLVLNQAEAEGYVRVNNEVLACPDFEAVLSPQDEKIWQQVKKMMDEQGVEVPTWPELMPKGVNKEYFTDLQQWLIRKGYLVPLEDGRYMSHDSFEQAVISLKEKTDESFTIQEAKDVLNTSRKYLIPFLETLDKQGYTLRQETRRIWRKKASPKH
jgi:selenocysteine-specific elongation factor